MKTDRAGFTRRWGIHLLWTHGAPWFSLGIHLDWHTPTLDLFIARGGVQIGRNMWDAEGRIGVGTNQSSGHTDQCLCWNRS